MSKIQKGRGVFIGGAWRSGNAGTLQSSDPRTNEPFFITSTASSSQVDEASHVAQRAQMLWAAKSLEERVKLVSAFGQISQTSAMAELISRESGKPLWEAQTEVKALAGKVEPSVSAFRARAGNIQFKQGDDAEVITKFAPMGVVAVVSPFNFPVHMANGHIIPALLAGNTVIWKPSELTPACAELYTKYWEEAGLPTGALNLLQGDGAVGARLTQAPGIDAVYFTGGTIAGKKIAQSCLASGKLAVLEMGGDCSIIVGTINRNDFAAAANIVLQSAFITAGQRCTTARRLLLTESAAHSDFLDYVVAVARQLRVDPHSNEAFYGCLTDPRAATDVLKFQRTLIKNGGQALMESESSETSKNLLTPGILLDAETNFHLTCESMGPLLRVFRTKDFSSSITLANRSPMRLAAAVITSDDREQALAGSQLDYGNVNFNQNSTGNSAWGSFGGYGDSGNHRPSGFLATDYCVKAQAVFVRKTLPAPAVLPGLSVGH
ncbi:aldehyde dehydrogenase family protein [Terricaulis sp.]|uniref:aldehyde dehydrogenase family protein n=1 Tax=Terricaulis sp. TaxID=2768686 RepID=UPI00378306D9